MKRRAFTGLVWIDRAIRSVLVEIFLHLKRFLLLPSDGIIDLLVWLPMAGMLGVYIADVWGHPHHLAWLALGIPLFLASVTVIGSLFAKSLYALLHWLRPDLDRSAVLNEHSFAAWPITLLGLMYLVAALVLHQMKIGHFGLYFQLLEPANFLLSYGALTFLHAEGLIGGEEIAPHSHD